jgi:membrane AbrB-like protein
MPQFLAPLLTSLIFLAAARYFNIPGGAFLGAIIGGALTRALYAKAKGPPQSLYNLARVFLGLTIGIQVNRQILDTVVVSIVPVALMIIGLVCFSFLTAWGISKLSGLDFTTTLCGASPGAASAMVILSDELGGQSSIVAVLHIIRIVVIVALMPAVIGFFQPAGAAGQELIETAVQAGAAVPALNASGPAYYGKLILLILGGLPAAHLFRRLKIPGAEILAGIFLAAFANPLILHIDGFPGLWTLFPMWILGSSIGSQMTKESFAAIKKYAFFCILLTLILVTAGFVLGWLLYAATSMGLLTSLIGACPGGMDVMILLAGEMHANAPLVATMHTARMIIVMLLMPLIIRKITRKKGPKASP